MTDRSRSESGDVPRSNTAPLGDAEVVDTHGAALITGLSVATLNTKRSRGDGPPYVKLGRSVRYRVADLRRWRDARLVSNTAEATNAGR